MRWQVEEPIGLALFDERRNIIRKELVGINYTHPVRTNIHDPELSCNLLPAHNPRTVLGVLVLRAFRDASADKLVVP